MSGEVVVRGLNPADLALGRGFPTCVRLPVFAHITLGEVLATVRALDLLPGLEVTVELYSGRLLS